MKQLLTNDFLFSSNEFINSKGFVTNYDIIIKKF